jgi:hypothetical protein
MKFESRDWMSWFGDGYTTFGASAPVTSGIGGIFDEEPDPSVPAISSAAPLRAASFTPAAAPATPDDVLPTLLSEGVAVGEGCCFTAGAHAHTARRRMADWRGRMAVKVTER